MENLKTAFENDEQKNQMKEYNVLFSYLKEENWDENGLPTDDGDFNIIGTVKAESREIVQKWIDEGDIYSMEEIGKCKEITEIFRMEDYAEDTLEAVRIL